MTAYAKFFFFPHEIQFLYVVQIVFLASTFNIW